MALYVDSAYLDDIMQVAKTIPLAGVTTNPTILLAARERGQQLDPLTVLRELLSLVDGTIFMQPGADTEEELLQQALAYIELDPARVVPKIPMTQKGLRVAHQIKQRGYRLSFTAVTSVTQAYSAALTGADFVIPYFNRLERSGIDARERVAQMAELLKQQGMTARVLAASIKTPAEAATALLAGAHDLTVAPQVLLEMVQDPLSEQAIARFEQDWIKMNKL